MGFKTRWNKAKTKTEATEVMQEAMAMLGGIISLLGSHDAVVVRREGGKLYVTPVPATFRLDAVLAEGTGGPYL